MNDIQEIIYRLHEGQSVKAIHRDTGHAKKTIRVRVQTRGVRVMEEDLDLI